MTTLSTATLAAYLAAARELLDELNRESASGLITFRCAVLISNFDRMTRTLEREVAREASDGHDYLSTACFHGLHDRCRKNCKFCDERCRCPCHTCALADATEALDG